MKKFKITLETLNDYISRGLVMKQTHPTLPISVYNYSRTCQYENAWDEVTLACRGLILDDQGNLVAKGFEKFFNMEQLKPEEIPNESFDVFEKMDGCCDSDTKIVTDDGIKTIKEICDNDFNGNVLSYNIFSNKVEMKQITGVNISENINNWYEIKIENDETIKLTGNHMVYLPELKCYRRVDELKNDDIVLLL